MDVIRPDIDAALPFLTLSQHAGMVRRLVARQLDRKARRRILDQLAVLETRQLENVIANVPAIPYRAEILRQLLLGMTKEGNALESSPSWNLDALWPQVRQALERLEPEYRQGPMDVLRYIVSQLNGQLHDDIEAALGGLSAMPPGGNPAVAATERRTGETSRE